MPARRTIGLYFLATALACTSPTPSTSVAPQRSCAIASNGGAAPDSLRIAASSSVDAANVPVATTSAERFVFAQSYETLVDVDCDGRVYPGLAESWTRDASNTRATLVLRRDAHFWNGDAINVRDVIAAWRMTADTSHQWTSFAVHIADAATIVDDHTITVSLPDTNLSLLAEPALAVYRRLADSRWPEGSGPYHVAETAPGLVDMAAVAAGPRLAIRFTRDADARDQIDAGADLVLSTGPITVSYAATRPGLESIPLPWSETYVLALPHGAMPAFDALAKSDSGATFRAALAMDAVRPEARGAGPPYWWTAPANCEFTNAGAPAPLASGSARIVYSTDDQPAQQLAERLVALGAAPTSFRRSRDAFDASLHSGDELAFVFALPRRSLAPCHDLAALMSRVPWFGANTLVPLVDIRTRAIVKRGALSATIDWDGTIRIASGSPQP